MSGSVKSAQARSVKSATKISIAKKAPKAKAPTKKEKKDTKLESGFGVPVENMESKIKAE